MGVVCGAPLPLPSVGGGGTDRWSELPAIGCSSAALGTDGGATLGSGTADETDGRLGAELGPSVALGELTAGAPADGASRSTAPPSSLPTELPHPAALQATNANASRT